MERAAILLVSVALLIAGCEEEPHGRKVSLSAVRREEVGQPLEGRVLLLRVAVAPAISPRESFGLYRPLLKYISRQVGMPVKFLHRRTHAEVNDLIRYRHADMAFVSDYAYVEGQRNFGMQMLVVPIVMKSRTHHAYIIVPKAIDARSLFDLKGKSFAFSDPLSSSGWLFPTFLLNRIGETPESFFGRHLFTYSHDNTVNAVAEELVDAGAVDSLVYEYMLANAPAYRDKTKVIQISSPWANPPVVVHPQIDPILREELRRVFLTMHESEEGREVLAPLMIDRFIRSSDRAYDPLRRMVEELSGVSVAGIGGRAGYVGSRKCKGCHVSEGNSWSETLHSRMMRTMEKDRKIGVVSIASIAPPFPIKDVAYVLGNMRMLLFLKKKDNGFVVIPHQYNLAGASWEPLNVQQWDHFSDSGADKSPAKTGELSWSDRCAGCHTTGYDPNARTFAEASIACESCHGPGARHAESRKRDDIINPAALQGEKANHVCAQCHARGDDTSGKYPFPVGYTPGEDLSKRFVFAEPIKRKNSDLFWGNGMARQHHAQYNELIQSKHFQNGLHCFDCHEVHGFRPTPPSPKTQLMARTERFLLKKRARFICLKCHTTRETEFDTEEGGTAGKIVDRHTHHPPVIMQRVRRGTSGGRHLVELTRMYCGDCHMPREQTGEASYDIRAHTFTIPSPSDTIAYGAPNGCNDCHSTQSAKWAKERIAQWRRERENR